MTLHEQSEIASTSLLDSPPPGWSVVTVGDLFDIKQGKALNKKTREGDSQRPFLRTANVFWGRIDLTELDHMHFTAAEEARLALRPGDLLTCEGGDIGRTAIWEGKISPCFYQNHLHRLRAKRDDVEPRFYMFWLQCAHTQLELYSGAGNRTTIPNLSQSRLSAFPVPFAPLRLQQAIAGALDTLLHAKAAAGRREAAIDGLFQSLLFQIMTGTVKAEDLLNLDTSER